MVGETTVLHLPFAGGIDEKIAKEYLDASSRQASILNGDFVKVGVIDKRTGMAHLPTALVSGGNLPDLASGTRVIGWSRSSLSILCSTGLYQYVRAPVGGATNGGVVGTANLPNVVALRRHITTGDQGSPPVLCDLNYSGQLLRICIFWDSSFNVMASVYDVESGNVILEPIQIYANTGTMEVVTAPFITAAFDLPGISNGNPRPVIVIHDASDLKVRYVQYNPSTNSFTTPTMLVATPCHVVDAAPYEDDPANGWLVLHDVGGSDTGFGISAGTFGTTIRLLHWAASGLQTSVDQAIEAGHDLYLSGYTCGRYGQSVWMSWTTKDSGNTYFWAATAAADGMFSITSGPTEFDSVESPTGFFLTGIAHLGTDKAFVQYTYKAGVTTSSRTYMQGWRVLRTNAGAISTWARGRAPLGLLPATRPFVAGGEVYAPFYYNLNYTAGTPEPPCRQITLYLCKFEGVSDSMEEGVLFLKDVCRPVATIAPRQVAHAFQGAVDLWGGLHTGHPSSADRDATRVAVGLKTLGPGGETLPLIAGPSWSADFFFDEASRRELYQTTELGAELSISGGVPFVADGQTAFEDGFFNYPEFSYAILTGAATSLTTGAYTFAVVYRSTDSSGLVHRSAPYITNTVNVTGGGAGPLVYIMPPLASYRDAVAAEGDVGKVYADVYMTTVNGSALYYKDSVVVSNDTSWPTAFIYEAESEPDTTAPLLYTTGGVMDNVNPPASKIQITHQKRKAIVDETLQGVWFSKQFSEGEAPGFNETLYVPFPEGGDITALGSFGGKFFAFKARSIWAMEGAGPAITGLGASWTDPEPLTTDVGCKSWHSVIAIPKGLLFQAPNNGIYLLGPDLQVSFIGKSVVDRTDAYPNIVSAQLVPLSNHVRFICLDEAGEDHLVIVYDYLLDTWTTHQYARLSDIPVSACVSFESTPRYTVLTADGELWQERLPSDAQRYMDQDSEGEDYFVPTVITVPFVKMQVQGYHKAKRVQFFGEQMDDCGLRMDLAFNYDDTVRQSAIWSSTQLKSLNVRGQVETYVGNAYNKQMSLQLTVSDTEGAAMTTGAGMRFVGAAIELQNLGPRYMLMSAGARR
jgi:hypothetical protein